MAKRKTNLTFQQIFEEHPIKSCIGCFLFGVTATYFFSSLWYDNKIESIKERYEDKIENINKSHAQDLEIKEIKLKDQEGTKYYLNIEPDSKMAIEITNLLNNAKNEK